MFASCCASTASGTRTRLSASATTSPIRRMGTVGAGTADGSLADDGWSQESVALVIAHHFCPPKPREWRPRPRFPREISPSLVSFYASHRQSDGGSGGEVPQMQTDGRTGRFGHHPGWVSAGISGEGRDYLACTVC